MSVVILENTNYDDLIDIVKDDNGDNKVFESSNDAVDWLHINGERGVMYTLLTITN
jgi:hypothetical protein